MRCRILVLATAAAWSCVPAPRPAVPAPAELDVDERAVLAAALNRELGDASFIVVSDSTRAWDLEEGLIGHLGQFVRLPEATLVAMIRDYGVRNRVPAAMPADLPTARPVRIFPSREFVSMAALERSTGAGSYHLLSRPGFDARREHALVHAVRACGGLCSRSIVVVLERGADGWRVVGVAPLSIS